MRTYGTIYEVIEAFFNQEEGPYKNQNESVYFEDHTTLYSYGHHFPLVFRHHSGRLLFNGDKYSNTTAKHQNTARHFYSESRGDLTISFSALDAAGIDYKSKRLEILDAEADQRDDFFYDPNFYGPAAQELAKEFIKNAPKGATVSFETWEDDNGTKHTAPNSWHRPPAAVLKTKFFKRDERVLSNPDRDRGKPSWDCTFKTETVKHPAAFYILGMDEGSYFISKLPGKVKSVPEAYEILKPEPIKTAEAQGLNVQRQGEWFFFPIATGKAAKGIYKQLAPNFNLTDASNLDGAAHTVTRGGRIGDIIFTNEIMAELIISAPKMNAAQLIVSGQVRHSEGDHAQLKLSTLKYCKIFAAHINTATESFSSSGDVD